jgi:hypothetical protein
MVLLGGGGPDSLSKGLPSPPPLPSSHSLLQTWSLSSLTLHSFLIISLLFLVLDSVICDPGLLFLVCFDSLPWRVLAVRSIPSLQSSTSSFKEPRRLAILLRKISIARPGHSFCTCARHNDLSTPSTSYLTPDIPGIDLPFLAVSASRDRSPREINCRIRSNFECWKHLEYQSSLASV